MLTFHPYYYAQRPSLGFRPRELSQIVPVINHGRVDAPAVGFGAKLKAMAAPPLVVAVLVPVNAPVAALRARVMTLVEGRGVGTPFVPAVPEIMSV